MARRKGSPTGRCQGCNHLERVWIERLLATGASIKRAASSPPSCSWLHRRPRKSTPLAMSCTCPALPNGTPVLATSFGSIVAFLPVDAGGILEIAVSMTRDGPFGPFDPNAIA
jgi:hypothetical protein